MGNMKMSFLKNTTYTRPEGRHAISCKKGLFSVSAATKEEAYREGLHYFAQYFSDGEYNIEPC